MNGLTLRISTDKKTKPIKKDIEKEDIQILLPTNYHKDYGFDKLLSSKTVEEQVKAIKEICTFINDVNQENDNSAKILDLLIHIFLHLKHKSPLLSPLLKFFLTAREEFRMVIENSFKSHLELILLDREVSPRKISDYSMTLLAYLDKASLAPCYKEIMVFILQSLKRCHSDFHAESTPMKKLDIINSIHSCVQLGICLSQKSEVSEEELITISVQILSEPDLPIDTRAAAGVLAANLSVHSSADRWIKVFEKILNSENNIGTLSYSSGLLNVLSPEELNKQVEIKGSTDNAISLIYSVIYNIENKNASDSGIVLSAARCMVLLTRSLRNLPSTITKKLLDTLLVYLWSHIDHYMDAVRHLAVSALSNVGVVANTYTDLKIFQLISDELQNMSVEKRSKHAAISILLSHIPVEKIISRSPGLIDSLFAAALSNPPSHYAISSLENLISQDFKERADQSKWLELWVNPLLSAELSAPLEQLLASVLKIHPPVIQHIINLGFEENNKNIAVILTCLKIGRKNKLALGKDDNKTWRGLVDHKILEKCMYNYDEDVRLSCFALLVETSKSTEEFTPIELGLIKTFLKYNFANQDPAVRQKSLAYCKKFLTRLRDSKAGLTRRQLKSPRSGESNENISYLLSEYSCLIRETRAMCLESLFPGASPPRRSFAFGFLAIYKDSGFWMDFDENTVQILLSCLLDSYEENKLIAKQLLASMPAHLLKFDNEEHVDRYIEETLLLSSSIRPPDSISAAYYMSLLTSYDGIGSKSTSICNTSYHCLDLTLKALERELEVAKGSLLKAACSGPLYGHLFVIRHILQQIYLSDIGLCPKWRSLVQKIVQVAFDCNSVVAHVVYNSSPEGHLPMDLTYSLVRKESDPQVTSQMVLLCSWRTVKEVSLLLGEISESATISGDQTDNGLISEEQILAIGEHLTGLLSETKHRGAFEQAYIGFSKLTSRLWRCTSGSLHGLPQKWLDVTFECIATNENLSATRRSAGIPFIVQALICSELVSGSCKSLHKSMKFLLQLSKGESSEGRVHGLNILRVLYRGSSLGEAVGPYVAEGIATAISGFNANNWAERNSSTLLFSALMSRVFGVPRGKSESLSWRNKMTGRLFFQRYPNLYSELLSHLEASSKVEMYPALYPVLLLLGRLYPSSLEGTDSNLQLLKYLPFVMKCAESSVLKTRSLAATAVSSLIPSTSYIDYINQVISRLSLEEVTRQNHKHGFLLMILKLTEQTASLEDFKRGQIEANIAVWVDFLLQITYSPKWSYVAKDTSLQIIIQLVLNYFNYLPKSNKIDLIVLDILFDEALGEDSFGHYGAEIYYIRACVLHFLIYIKENKTDDLIYSIKILLESPSYEIRDFTLEFLNFIFLNSNSEFVSEMQENIKLNFGEPGIISVLSVKIRTCKEIENILLERFISVDKHHEDSVKVLKVLSFFPGIFDGGRKQISVDSLYTLCKDSPSSISCQAISCMDSFMASKAGYTISEKDIEVIFDVINEFSDAESDDECRKTTALLLSNNFSTLIKKTDPLSRIEIWISAVRLLLDEVIEIREIVCTKLVGNFVPSKAVEILLEQFIAENEMQTSLVGLLYWVVGEDSPSEDTDETMVFDKGAANTYYEEMVLNQVACRLLSNIVQKDRKVVDLVFDEDHSNWLARKTNVLGGATLRGFVESYQSSICLSNNLLESLPCRPYEYQSLLQLYKSTNLLKSV